MNTNVELATAAGDLFDIPATNVRVPRDVDLDGDWLVWGDRHNVKRAGLEALKAFGKLENDTGPGILAYAHRFGPLRLCGEHELPTTHALALYRVNPPFRCHVRRRNGRDGERLSSWRSLAGQAAAIIRQIARLKDRDLGSDEWFDDWKMLKAGPVRPVFVLRSAPQSIAVARGLLVAYLNAWLAIAGTRMRFHITSKCPDPYISGGLFGVLGLQMAAILAETNGWAPCSICFTLYQIPKGHFREGTLHLCGRAQCKKRADQLKSGRWRSGKAKRQRRRRRSRLSGRLL